MRYPHVTALLACLAFAACSAPEPIPDADRVDTPLQRVTITTWNLQWFPGKEPGYVADAERQTHIDAVTAVLRDLDPDILCLQEVKEVASLDGLASALPGHSVRVVSSFRGTQEVAILSRLAPEAAFMEPFEAAEATPPRGFAYAAFRSGDHVLAVYTVHLKSNSGGIAETAPKREESSRQLLGHADEMTAFYKGQGLRCSVVLSGDFNYDPGRADWAEDDTFRVLKSAGFSWAGEGLPREETVTWLSDGRFPDAAFDHFMVRAASGVEVSPASTAKTGREVSDHRALTVTIEM